MNWCRISFINRNYVRSIYICIYLSSWYLVSLMEQGGRLKGWTIRGRSRGLCQPLDGGASFSSFTFLQVRIVPAESVYTYWLVIILCLHRWSRIYSPENQDDNGESTMNEDVFPIEKWMIFPKCHVSFQGCNVIARLILFAGWKYPNPCQKLPAGRLISPRAWFKREQRLASSKFGLVNVSVAKDSFALHPTD